MLTPLLQNFISESRDALQAISEKLLVLEKSPDDAVLLNELFRIVHTLKGNSGLFDFPAMTNTLHAAEDLMDTVREGHITYSERIADLLLDLMDYIVLMLDDIETSGRLSAEFNEEAVVKAKTMRALIEEFKPVGQVQETKEEQTTVTFMEFDVSKLSETKRMSLFDETVKGNQINLIQYLPEEGCYFKGEDPYFLASQTPNLLWYDVYLRETPKSFIDYDAYRCILAFDILSKASKKDLLEHYRYVPDQINIRRIEPHEFINLSGELDSIELYDDFIDDTKNLISQNDMEGLKRSVSAILEVASEKTKNAQILRWVKHLLQYDGTIDLISTLIDGLKSEGAITFKTDIKEPEETPSEHEMPEEALELLVFQVKALKGLKECPDTDKQKSFLEAILLSIENTLKSTKQLKHLEVFHRIVADDEADKTEELIKWLKDLTNIPEEATKIEPIVEAPAISPPPIIEEKKEEAKFGRRAEDQPESKILKVDESRIDRLMNLIGEIVVAKNSLPYLANRADRVYGIAELSKEIKSQYSVINRITEELQDAIMQVRMIPVSFVFQRFPRFVRDISKKLAKDVKLVMEGEDTEADKNVIESLADPLIHIIRNSLDHGIENPSDRINAGKPATGTIKISARQESDKVIIEITDDGKGIDPEVIKRKAYEKGLIDEERIQKLTDDEAVNLIFLPGFSTADAISDISGRGVGMDVVRTGVLKVGGTVRLKSAKGQGTTITLALPLSMAVSNVMIVETANRRFGIPMDVIIETVRTHKDNITTIKGKMTTVLRGTIVPMISLNELLRLSERQKFNDDGEYAVVVINSHLGRVGLIIDDLHGTADIILKPLVGFMASFRVFSGTAILGDGSVLLVINTNELF